MSDSAEGLLTNAPISLTLKLNYSNCFEGMPVKAMRYFLIMAQFAAAAAIVAAEPQLLSNEAWHKKFSVERVMQISAATFFGAGGVERFDGVSFASDGRILAFGNSWGEPFPRKPVPDVIGTDQPWDVPLYAPGMDRDAQGDPVGPLDINPNRTGFFVLYSADLSKVQKVVRFGWGAGSIDAVLARRGAGGVVLAGTATGRFSVPAATVNTLKPGDDINFYGRTVYEHIVNPGDVYVGQLNRGLTGFEWIWILQAHQRPPKALFEAPDGSVVFDCVGIKRITANGRALQELPCRTVLDAADERFLAGVHPVNGNLIFGGARISRNRFQSWRAPLLEQHSADGEFQRRYYDWIVDLVNNPVVDTPADAGLSAACVMPDGRIAVTGVGTGHASVLSFNPLNIMQPLGKTGIGFSADAEPRFQREGNFIERLAHLAVFDPSDTAAGAYTLWCAFEGYRPRPATVEGMKGLPDGRLVIWGQSAKWLVQTTTDYFRAADQVVMEYNHHLRPHSPRLNPDGKEIKLGVGGTGPYSAIFDAELGSLLWSSAMAGCYIADVAEHQGRIAIVSQAVIPADGWSDGNRPAVTDGAAQTTPGGGWSDGHIFLLQLPDRNEGR